MNRCKSQRVDCPCKRCRAGWFSRRHETSAENKAAFIAYRARASKRPRQFWNVDLHQWEKVS